MKKGTRITLICIISLLILLVIGGTIFGYVQKYANAEEVGNESTQILNFNQVYKTEINSNTAYGVTTTSTEYTLNISGTATGSEYFYRSIQDNVIINGHKYYFACEDVFTDYLYLKYTLGSSQVINTQENQFIFTANSNNVFRLSIYYSNGYTYDITIKPILIDLSLMYGLGSEPDLETCKNTFKAYYSYNTGSPMTLSGIEQYNSAINDIFENYKYTLNRNALSTQTQATNLMGTLSDTISFGYNDENWYIKGAMYCPLFTIINSGAVFSFEVQFYAPDQTATKLLCIGTYVDNELNELYSYSYVPNGTTYHFEFTTPIDISTIYVYQRDPNNNLQIVELNYIVGTFNIKASQLDVASMILSSYSSGYQNAEQYYQRGNQGFTNIYNIGFNDGQQTAETGFGSAWEFIESAFTGIGSIFAIELLPNIPLSTFILVPLMLSLIFFIIKLVKGGS